MKKYLLYTLSCLALLVSASSCHWLDKEPDTELTMDMVYADKDKLMGAFAYVYSFIPNPCWDYVRQNGWEVLADDVAPSEKWQQWGWDCIPKITGSWSVNSTWEGNFWAGMPQRIRAAYLFIENAHPIEGYFSQEEIDLMKTECRFLACYYWWEMARTYGGIPFTPNYIAPTDAPIEELYTPSVPFDQIVDWLDKELLEVSKLLPAVQVEPQKYGRATSIMALAVRANMLLFAASDLVNGNEWYSDYRNVKGELIFNPVYDANKWVKAAEACQLLVDQAEANGYALYKEYNDNGTIDPFCSLENMFQVNWTAGNREILFPYTNDDVGNSYEEYTRHASSITKGHNNGLGLYQGFVDAFFMKNGLPIDDPNSGYVESGFSVGAEKRDTKWRFGTGQPGEITGDHTYNMYCNREPRFYLSVTYHGAWCEYTGRRWNFFYDAGKGSGSDNHGGHDAAQAGYLVRKRICQTDKPNQGQWLRNRPLWVYRLGGAYLDLAEALCETNDLDGALKYLNPIRERAGVRQYTFDAVMADDAKFINVAKTKEAVRNIIRMERRVELCVEGVRWFDIRRWMIAEDLPDMNGPCYGMNRNGSNEADFFQKTEFQTRVWKRQYYWFPVYVAEMEKNPNLTQAPFWN